MERISSTDSNDAWEILFRAGEHLKIQGITYFEFHRRPTALSLLLDKRFEVREDERI